MSDEVYRAIACASSGFVESPAGCGKTEAIVRTVGAYCRGCQLVLTHTHAGVDALRQRFREHNVPTPRYHVDTIAGWSWGWVRKYPDNAGYRGSRDIVEWGDVYAAMSSLLQKAFVRQSVVNSYAGVIVDEYQDCTVSMHQLIVALKRLLPCRVLGDDLQGIFGFRRDPLIGWDDVKGEFANDLGVLDTPHRWIKAGNEQLGRWLLGTREDFRQDREPDYRGSPIDRRSVSARNLAPELVRLTHAKQGKTCVIGPKMRRLERIETALVSHNYRVLEPNELSALQKLIIGLSGSLRREKSQAAIEFLGKAYGGVPANDKDFIARILNGDGQRPHRADRRTLCEKHNEGIGPYVLLDLLKYIEQIPGVSCKLVESVSALKCILEKHLECGTSLEALYADEIARRKYQSRSRFNRCVGSTLLVKGLEFDHAIVVRGSNWQKSWGNYRDLYVALTRGSKTATLMEVTA